MEGVKRGLEMAVLKVNEIFLSVQGEGACIGRPCAFVRLTGCNLRCHWCDTTYAYEEGEEYSVDTVLEEVRSFDCSLVEVTGGEPLLQPAVHELLGRLVEEGFEVLLETNGSRDLREVNPEVVIIQDLKCPGSGMTSSMRVGNLERLSVRDQVKFVVADRADYEWAREMMRAEDLSTRCQVLFSPVWGVQNHGTLAEWILEDRLRARMQLQLHRCLWPGVERGV